jgi:hypothetical protein
MATAGAHDMMRLRTMEDVENKKKELKAKVFDIREQQDEAKMELAMAKAKLERLKSQEICYLDAIYPEQTSAGFKRYVEMKKRTLDFDDDRDCCLATHLGKDCEDPNHGRKSYICWNGY